MLNKEILIVTDNNLETVGGEQESTKIILSELNELYRFSVYQPGLNKPNISNVNYYGKSSYDRIKKMIKNPFSFIKYYIELLKTIRKINPSIIHTQAQVSFMMVNLLKKIRLINKEIKTIHTERGLYKKYNKFFQSLLMFFMNELTVLVTTTHYNLNDWKKALDEKNDHINYQVIPNTAGKLFETYDESKERVIDDKFIIGFSGRYTDWKNWPLALEIIEELNNQIGEKLEVRIAVGALDETSEKETLKMFADLEESIGNRFKGKLNINLDEMNLFYYELDLFILTSKPNTESFGRTLVEAMSRKTAVLTTNAGGSEEVVGNEKNICYTFEELINRITQLESDSTELYREKMDNMKIVKNHYSLNSNIISHNKLYRNII
ncbi:glycosyltransferase family 4 protein [Aerococcus urinaeequi]|uniref:glycosyltransferase family 4 protein n=1 Tax=Aerococcus urinaeequi TaxID=51665 RepID=UPI003B3B5B41